MKTNIIFLADDAKTAHDSVTQLVGHIRGFLDDKMKKSFKITETEESAFVIQDLYGDEIVIRAMEARCRPDYFAWMFWNAVEDEEEVKTNYKKIAKEIGFKESDWYERTIIDLCGASSTEMIALTKAAAAHNQDAPWLAHTNCEYNNCVLSSIAIGEQLRHHVSNFLLRNRPKSKEPAWRGDGEMIDFGELSCRIHNSLKSTWGYGHYVAFLLRIVDIFRPVTVLPFHSNSKDST
ncbi:hypothetical protein J6S46_01175 [Candidatus Saccharibacteria bacterium]|nr:hypothetical protein [Candidatus Saccharibacteria bacterium]